MSNIVTNVACAACGLICENVAVRIDQGKIVATENACPKCAAKLIGKSANSSAPASVGGRPCSLDEAVAEATKVLAASQAPLIYGLDGSDVATQRAAIALADHLGVTIDPALPEFHRNGIQAVQAVGISTCTLGEIKHHADLIVFWGCDPDVTHPALRSRFLGPAGDFVRSRKIVAIGSQKPLGHLDEFFQLPVEHQYTFLSTLRAMIAGREVGPTPFDRDVQTLADMLKSASYSVNFFGAELIGVPNLEALFQLVRQLNAQTRSAALGLGGTQHENVLAWQTGYPCSVNFALGYPRYCPQTFSANFLLENDRVDSVLLVGSQGIELLSPAAQKQLGKLPVVLFSGSGEHSELEPAVCISTAVPGIHCAGTVFRMDGVPLWLPAIFDSELPSAADVLSAIQQGVSTSCV